MTGNEFGRNENKIKTKISYRKFEKNEFPTVNRKTAGFDLYGNRQ